MKKMLAMGVLTLTAALISDQQAHAWINAKFSIGLNYNLQSGGNNWLWGAFRNGQPPGPEVAYPGCHNGACPSRGGQNTFPYVYPQYGPYDFQWFGKNNTAPQGAPAAQQPAGVNRVSSYGYSNYYQPVSYTYGYNNPYYQYYYPQSYYGYQVPSYWYGR